MARISEHFPPHLIRLISAKLHRNLRIACYLKLQILRTQAGMLRDPSQHSRPDYHRIMKCPRKIAPFGVSQNHMRAALGVYGVPASEQCVKTSFALVLGH